MFHETGHLAFKLPHDYVTVVQDQATDLLEMKREADREKKVGSQTIESGSEAAAVPRVVDTDFDRIRTEAFDAEGLFQEIFCDTWAANAVLASSVVSEERVCDALRAIYIGFYHLQALAYVEGLVNYPHDEERRLHRFAQVQIRSHCLRSHLIFHYEARMMQNNLGDFDPMARISKQLVQDQTRYYETIFDGFMNVGHAVTKEGELDRFIRDVLDQLATVPGFAELDELERKLQMDEMTRAMTGWPSLSTVQD
jgi:hypothetical protein